MMALPFMMLVISSVAGALYLSEGNHLSAAVWYCSMIICLATLSLIAAITREK